MVSRFNTICVLYFEAFDCKYSKQTKLVVCLCIRPVGVGVQKKDFYARQVLKRLIDLEFIPDLVGKESTKRGVTHLANENR